MINKIESNASAGSGCLVGLTTLLLKPSSSVHPDVNIRLVTPLKVLELLRIFPCWNSLSLRSILVRRPEAEPSIPTAIVDTETAQAHSTLSVLELGRDIDPISMRALLAPLNNQTFKKLCLVGPVEPNPFILQVDLESYPALYTF